jgi:hypothetical protein
MHHRWRAHACMRATYAYMCQCIWLVANCCSTFLQATKSDNFL